MNIAPIHSATSFGRIHIPSHGESAALQLQISEMPNGDKFEKALNRLDETTGKDEFELRMHSEKSPFGKKRKLTFSLLKLNSKKAVASGSISVSEADLAEKAVGLLDKLTGKYNKLAVVRNQKMK